MIEINIDPVAFTIGSIEIRWYGIMIALAILVLVLWTLWQAKRGAKLSYDTVIILAIVGIPSGIIFSRLLHVIDRWEFYSHNPGQIIGGEGLTIYGAILGAVLGTWIYSKFRPFNYGYAADLVAPGIILAQAIGRVGCTINGCCYGTHTSLPWGIFYTHPNVNVQTLAAGVTHPTQVYEIIFLLLLFGGIMLLKGRLKPDGSLFLVYLGGYSLWRFGIDFVREGTPFLFSLHQAQVIGIIVVVVAIIILVRRRVRRVEREAVNSTPQDAGVS
jgi:phosphatidylglycerol:prolipoprotein diacylglycerol transferase